MLAAVCPAQEKPIAKPEAPKAPAPVSITKEQGAAINQSLSTINLLEQQKALEVEKVKNYVLRLQIMMKLDDSWEFHFDSMTFVKKSEPKEAKP